MNKDLGMGLSMAALTLVGGYIWSLQRPDIATTIISVIFVYVPAMFFIWLGFQHPGVFKFLLILIAIILGISSALTINSQNEDFLVISWGYIVFWIFIGLLMLFRKHEKSKKTDSRYGFKLTLWFVFLAICYFIGSETDVSIGIILSIIIPAVFFSMKSLIGEIRSSRE